MPILLRTTESKPVRFHWFHACVMLMTPQHQDWMWLIPLCKPGIVRVINLCYETADFLSVDLSCADAPHGALQLDRESILLQHLYLLQAPLLRCCHSCQPVPLHMQAPPQLRVCSIVDLEWQWSAHETLCAVKVTTSATMPRAQQNRSSVLVLDLKARSLQCIDVCAAAAELAAQQGQEAAVEEWGVCQLGFSHCGRLLMVQQCR